MNMKEIKLTRGFVALVDDEDFEELSKSKWCVQPSGYTFYAMTRKPAGKYKQKTIRMHRVVMKTPDGMDTDHIDGNGLNNQKSNLRICTRSQNQFNKGKCRNNTSGYKGVSWFKPMEKWDVRITHNKKQVHIGYFDDKEDAAKAYLEASKKYHKDFVYER